MQSQLTMDDIDGITANLRFLQRMYRTYANNDMVPADTKKEKRKGFVGIKLLKFMEESLKAKGVQKIYMGHKLHINLTPILERLGYKQIEKLFTKVI